MKQTSKATQEAKPKVIRAPIVNLVGSTVKWDGGREFPDGLPGKVLDQRVPTRDWIIVYVDFGDYGLHWVSAKRVVIA